MSRLEEFGPVETLEFKWGKKRGRGAKNKAVQYYESFTYDGVDYALYDTVYLHKEGEPEPYIGMLVQIFENEDTIAKKVKVHWFFRPSEISNWIEEGTALENEIFLASGEGKCSASVNHLEAISGKCNVVCTLQDERNPQPSEQEFELADYFFYRAFDVDHCTVSELVGDKVAGLEVKCVFNRKERRKNTVPIPDKKLEVRKRPLVDATDSSDVSKTISLNGAPENVEIEKTIVPLSKAKMEAEGSVALQNRFPSNSVADGLETLQKNKNGKSEETLNIDGNNSKPLKKNSSFAEKKPNLSNKAKVGDAVKVANANGFEVSRKNNNKKSVETLTRENNDLKPLTKSSSFTDSKMKIGERKDSGGLDLVVKVDKSTIVTASFTDKREDSLGLNEVVKADKSANPFRKRENKESCQKLNATSEFEVRKRKPNEGFLGPDKGLKLQKTEEMMKRLSNEKLPKVSARNFAHEERGGFDEFEVTRRPVDERSKWFGELPWEEKIKNSYDKGRVIQLSNLDPGWTSSEVEDLIWHAFKEHCAAKMVLCTANPNSRNGLL